MIENACVNLAYKYFIGLAVDDEVPDDTTISYLRAQSDMRKGLHLGRRHEVPNIDVCPYLRYTDVRRRNYGTED